MDRDEWQDRLHEALDRIVHCRERTGVDGDVLYQRLRDDVTVEFFRVVRGRFRRCYANSKVLMGLCDALADPLSPHRTALLDFLRQAASARGEDDVTRLVATLD